jgi:hypothetical protein
MKYNEIGPRGWHEKFMECLGKEFTNKEYFPVHHLLVLCYMIQCDVYSDKYKEKAYKILDEFIDGKEPKDIMIENKLFFNDKNNLSIIKEKDERKIKTDKWEKTIMDIRTENAEIYCIDIKSWALNIGKNK